MRLLACIRPEAGQAPAARRRGRALAEGPAGTETPPDALRAQLATEQASIAENAARASVARAANEAAAAQLAAASRVAEERLDEIWRLRKELDRASERIQEKVRNVND